MPMCIENNLSLNQFDAILIMIKDMIQQVEAEHRSKLEQLTSIQQMSSRYVKKTTTKMFDYIKSK